MYSNSQNIGYGVARGSTEILRFSSAVVVLKPMPNTPLGFIVITAYPK